MSREECIKMLDKFHNQYHMLHWAIIFFFSPIANRLESRHILSENYTEVLYWLEDLEKQYRVKEIPFISYIDYGLHTIFHQ